MLLAAPDKSHIAFHGQEKNYPTYKPQDQKLLIVCTSWGTCLTFISHNNHSCLIWLLTQRSYCVCTHISAGTAVSN